VQTDHTLT